MPTRRWVKGRLALGLACLCSAAGSAPATAPQAAPTASITIKALLFNGETGGFSEDVIADTSKLGQVPISDYASTSTLIVVRISFGAQGRSYPAARVRLVATVTGRKPRPFVDRTVRLRAMTDDNVGHVGFWLDDTGCEPLRLRVTLIGAGAVLPKQADLPFICYE